MTPRSDPNPPEAESAAARLERLLRAKACIVYHENLPDREYPEVKCSIYGAPKTNELFIRIAKGPLAFVAVTPSPLEFPVMADRLFGLDVADHAVAFGLADQLWEQHREALLKG
jgi:hypothetical protein